jgi:hypothetical protein
MSKLKYLHISRTMSEINEEMEKINLQVENDNDMIAFTTIITFCDWLCGVSDMTMSSLLALAKCGENALKKGVPPQDVNSFIIDKINKIVSKGKIEKT